MSDHTSKGSYVPPRPALKPPLDDESSGCSFGCVNVETGEAQTGYTDKQGRMKFKRQPWWRRIFQSPPREKVWLEVRGFERSRVLGLTGETIERRDIPCSVYKEWNPLSGEIYEIYATSEYGKVQLDVGAYNAGHVVVVEYPNFT